MLEIVKGLPDNVIGSSTRVGSRTKSARACCGRRCKRRSSGMSDRDCITKSIAGFRAPDGPIWRSVSTACRNGKGSRSSPIPHGCGRLWMRCGFCLPVKFGSSPASKWPKDGLGSPRPAAAITKEG